MELLIKNLGSIRNNNQTIDLTKNFYTFIDYNNSGKTLFSQLLWTIFNHDNIRKFSEKTQIDSLVIDSEKPIKTTTINQELIDEILNKFSQFIEKEVEWHLKQSLAPLLFEDEEIDDSSLDVIKASRSESVQSKEREKRNQENIPVHSFRTLLEDLGTICLNTVECTIREGSYRFSKITRPTSLQQSCVRFIGSFPNLYPVTGRWKFS